MSKGRPRGKPEKKWEYLDFDPRRIEKGVSYLKVNKMPINRVNISGLWPYVSKMQSGDVYIYFDTKPKSLKVLLAKLCKEFTKGTLSDNNLMVVEKSEKDGVILLKY